jgi:hypothetical protein
MEFSIRINEECQDGIFISDLVQNLTMTIASSNVEKKLRKKLRGDLPTDYAKNRQDLFMTLYKTWCCNPVSTLTLCLVSKHYELAYNLITKFPMLEIDFSTLKQFGQLV